MLREKVMTALQCQTNKQETTEQGWARNVKARDLDETETLISRDRDETETLASPAETRPRRDVCSSRDVIETLKYKFY